MISMPMYAGAAEFELGSVSVSVSILVGFIVLYLCLLIEVI